MPCLAHLDANGKSTHTNHNCKFLNSLKEDLKAGYERARKTGITEREEGKGRG
jgi:hypothetical protein